MLVAGTARADVLLPDPCLDKKAGDPCRTMIDQLPGTCHKELMPEGGKSHTPLDCMTEGDLRKIRPDPEEDKPLQPAEPPQAGWCSVAGDAPPWLALGLLALRRRRVQRDE